MDTGRLELVPLPEVVVLWGKVKGYSWIKGGFLVNRNLPKRSACLPDNNPSVYPARVLMVKTVSPTLPFWNVRPDKTNERYPNRILTTTSE